MLIEIGPEFNRFQGKDKKPSVDKYGARIPNSGKIRSQVQCL